MRTVTELSEREDGMAGRPGGAGGHPDAREDSIGLLQVGGPAADGDEEASEAASSPCGAGGGRRVSDGRGGGDDGGEEDDSDPFDAGDEAWVDPEEDDDIIIIDDDDADDADRPLQDGDEAADIDDEEDAPQVDEPLPSRPNLTARRPGRGRSRLPAAEGDAGKRAFKGQQRLLILEAWQKSGLPATEFAPLVGVTNHTLYAWRKAFLEHGPAGLEPRASGRKGGASRLPEATRRAILMVKQSHPDWGIDRIAATLVRWDGVEASPGAIQRVLQENGYTVELERTRPHAPAVRRFERSRPNELWQTDLFTFLLKRTNRRVYLVAFMDDQSRFIIGFGLHATASGAMVREVFEQAIASYGPCREILTDNGTQYKTWRGTSAFTYLCERRGIKQIVASPRRPQTLGKIERFWGSLWRELVEKAIFRDLDDARERIGHYMNYYNFMRVHSGIGGLVPADRYFEAAPSVLATLKANVAHNALELARHGTPRKPLYLTGRVGDLGVVSLSAEGSRVILTTEDGRREEVDLAATGLRSTEPGPVQSALPIADEPASPGVSPLDEALRDLSASPETPR